MANKNKIINQYKFGLAGNKKKLGINYWRFIFNGIESISGSEQMFYIELEMINPSLSPSEVLLGYKPRVSVSAEDLQYALAGTQAAQNLHTELLVQPSYCSLRIGKLGQKSKQLCSYFSAKKMRIQTKPFQIEIDNKIFSENHLSGFVSVLQEDVNSHPEYLCDAGYVTWNLDYEVEDEITDGYKNKGTKWFPYGLNSTFSGKINFDGVDYIVSSRKCFGYIERFLGSSFPDPWFHLSSSNMSSIITGKTMQTSAFSVQGVFENKVSFIGRFDDLHLDLCADTAKRNDSFVWDCTQAPEVENIDENLLHWSVSLNNKIWIVDIDVYCKIQDIFNRKLELPEGNRKILNSLQGATGNGEIKIYKHIKNTLEQIEHIKLTRVICEFGHSEEGAF